MDRIKILIATPDFFKLPPKKLTLETCDVANRTYFLHRDKIVAVGVPTHNSGEV